VLHDYPATRIFEGAVWIYKNLEYWELDGINGRQNFVTIP
jgi:hypothetical protein